MSNTKNIPTIYTDSGRILTTCAAVKSYYTSLVGSALNHEIELANNGGQIYIEHAAHGRLLFTKSNRYFDPGNDFDFDEEKQLPHGPSSFKKEMLIDGVREFAIDTAYRMNDASLAFVAVSTLAVLSASIGRRVMVRSKIDDDFTIVPNLWGMIIAPPSVKKTPLYSAAVNPLMQFAKEKDEEYKSDMLQYEIDSLAYQSMLKKSAESSKKDETTTTLVKPIEPTWTRYIAQDTTVEALAKIMANNSQGILISIDELSGFFTSLSKQGREHDRTFYLESFNGKEPLYIDRIVRAPGKVSYRCASIFGTIQPDKLVSLVKSTNRGSSGGDGLLQRFQLMVMVDKAHYRYVDKKPNLEARQDYTTLIELLLKSDAKDFGAQYDEHSDEVYYRFSVEANELFQACLALNFEKVTREATHNPAFSAHLGKFDSLFSSIALIFFYADKVRGLVNETAITEKYAQMAWTWCDYLEEHARKIYELENIDDKKYSRLEEKVFDKVREYERNGKLPISYGKLAGAIRGVNADDCRKILKGDVQEKQKLIMGLK